MEFIMRTNTVAGVIFGLLMVLAIPSQAQEHEDIDCSGLDASESVKDLCEGMWDEEEIRVLIRDEMNENTENFRQLEETNGDEKMSENTTKVNERVEEGVASGFDDIRQQMGIMQDELKQLRADVARDHDTINSLHNTQYGIIKLLNTMQSNE
jgi:hypothetical protein